jgi:hypothetical protein
MDELKKEVAREATSINQFIVVAVARRLAELRTMRYFEERGAQANPEDFMEIVAMAGTIAPREGDEVPEGWLDSPTADLSDTSKMSS